MAQEVECLFCKIVAGIIPVDIVYRSDEVVAFRDITPKAPTHILVVPTHHAENATELAKIAPNSLIAMFLAAGEIASVEGLAGYRSVFNTGTSAGQTVFHAHLHILGGRSFSWPPG
ncbi:MAG: histidine triad nucleotide-binding protein [Actinobacteria bacterium]|nr:histidine triad nucleotide-binding protein [Actinomycetota bacterium]